MPAQDIRLIFKMAVILTINMQEPRICAYTGKNIVLVCTCTALITREINTCNVPPYEEFNVIIFNDVCILSRDTNVRWPPFQPKIARRFIYSSASALNIHHD